MEKELVLWMQADRHLGPKPSPPLACAPQDGRVSYDIRLIAQRAKNDPPEPHGFSDELPLRIGLNVLLRVGRDACLQKLRTNHGPHCGPPDAARLSCM